MTITVKPDDGFKLADLTVTDKNGDELTLTAKGDGKYTFTMPAGKVEVKAAFVEEIETSPFTDVATNAYYYEAVKWAAEKGITAGTSGTTFSPDATCTCAQSVTFLFRAAKASASGSAGFRDVAANAYYAEAVKWAVDNGITSGIGGDLFGSNNDCTRAQIVTFLWRLYVGK